MADCRWQDAAALACSRPSAISVLAIALWGKVHSLPPGAMSFLVSAHCLAGCGTQPRHHRVQAFHVLDGADRSTTQY